MDAYAGCGTYDSKSLGEFDSPTSALWTNKHDQCCIWINRARVCSVKLQPHQDVLKIASGDS